MIDNLRIALDSPYPTELFDPGEPTYINNLLFSPMYDCSGLVTHHKAMLNNLRIRQFHSYGKLVIDNSLQKYALGNNFEDFPLSSMKEAVASLSDDLHCDISSALIRRMEYGIVIAHQSDLEPHKALLFYNGKEYASMQHGGLVYGSKCERSHYTIKGYNKSLEVKKHTGVDITPGLFRWEVAVKNMQCLHKRKPSFAIERVKDTLETGNLGKLADDLVGKFRNSNKRLVLAPDSMNLKALTAIARMENVVVREYLRKNNKETYKQDLRLYKSIQKVNELPERLEKLMAEKCRELIHS